MPNVGLADWPIGPVPVGGMSLGLDAVPVHRSYREALDATV